MRFGWPDEAHIYLSPHLDDVVLSCGGTIAQQARQAEGVAIVTVFAAGPGPRPLSPFAESLHARWANSSPLDMPPGDPTVVRRAEDLAAAAALGGGVRALHSPLADAIYRHDAITGEPLYASEEAIFGPVAADDPALTVLLAAPPLPAGARLLAPLGIGGHVDHALVREAVDRWNLPPDRVCYYEDYPYAEAGQAALEAALGDPDAWEPVVVALDEAAMAAKIAAVAAYTSQMSTFWADEAAMGAAIRAYAERVGGERYWVRRQAA